MAAQPDRVFDAPPEYPVPHIELEPQALSTWPWETDETKRYPDKDASKQTEFERRYPVDPVGNELNDNARVWRVYKDRMNELDGDTIAGWNDSINFLLVFAGLFSAVLTAFVVEFSKKLEPDYAELSSLSLLVLASIASGTNATLPPAADPRQFEPQASHRAINALWFTSLTLSLLVSVLAILAKQWILTFVRRMNEPVGNLRRWAHRHRAYRDGWDKWHLNAFISGLSFALHAALFLFLIGLLVHTRKLDIVTFVPVTILVVFALLIYCATTTAPLFDKTCPTETSFSVLLRRNALFLRGMVLRRPQKVLPPEHELHPAPMELASLGRTAPAAVELDRVVPDNRSKDVGVLAWIFNNLPGSEDVDVALDAAAWLKPDHSSRLIAASRHTSVLVQERLWNFSSGWRAQDLASEAANIARALRAALRFERGLGRISGLDQLLPSLVSVRTHDVPILLHALAVQIAIDRPNQNFDETQPQRVAVHELCQLFEVWARGESIIRPMPIGEDTHDIILELLSSVSMMDNVLRIRHCVGLVLSFYPHRAAHRWMELTTTTLSRAILSLQLAPVWNPPAEYWGPVYQAIYVWTWLFEHFSSIQSSGIIDHVDRSDIGRCFMVMLGQQEHLLAGSQAGLHGLTASQLQQCLVPFISDVPCTSADISRGCSLLRIWFRRTQTTARTWNDVFARVTFGIFDKSNSTTNSIPSANTRALIRAALHVTSSSASYDFKGRIEVETAREVLERSALNLLAPRTAHDGSTTSIWRLVVSTLQDTSIVTSLSQHVSIFCAQLSDLRARDGSLPIAEHFEQLVGMGYGTTFVLAAKPDTADAFEMARHIAALAPVQWAEMRPGLLAGQWSTSGFALQTPAELVARVDGLRPS